MRTINRLSWLVIAVAVFSLVMAVALVVGASVLVHVTLSLPVVWAALAGLIGFRILTERSGASSPAQPPSSPPPATHPEPELRLDDLEKIYVCFKRGDVSEAVYRRAVEQATRRFTPPPPLAPQRHRWWQ
jgi:hypothetical protein